VALASPCITAALVSRVNGGFQPTRVCMCVSCRYGVEVRHLWGMTGEASAQLGSREGVVVRLLVGVKGAYPLTQCV
jgi:hypothetical protein